MNNDALLQLNTHLCKLIFKALQNKQKISDNVMALYRETNKTIFLKGIR